MMGQKLRMSEVLQELQVRHTYLTDEVQRRRRYLQAVPDCRDRRRIELSIVADDAAARELEDLARLIRGGVGHSRGGLARLAPSALQRLLGNEWY
jgi:hypothetical protein